MLETLLALHGGVVVRCYAKLAHRVDRLVTGPAGDKDPDRVFVGADPLPRNVEGKPQKCYPCQRLSAQA